MSQERGDVQELRQELEDLKKTQAVQAATQSGAQATQAATAAGSDATQAAVQAGQATTTAAAQAGLAATVGAGALRQTLLGQRAQALEQQRQEAVGVDAHGHVGVRLLAGSAPQVDHRATTAER